MGKQPVEAGGVVDPEAVVVLVLLAVLVHLVLPVRGHLADLAAPEPMANLWRICTAVAPFPRRRCVEYRAEGGRVQREHIHPGNVIARILRMRDLFEIEAIGL